MAKDGKGDDELRALEQRLHRHHLLVPHRRGVDDMAARNDDFGLWLINFDPKAPRGTLFASNTEALLAAQASVRPVPVPWPASSAPQPDAPSTPPSDTDPLPQRDVLIVTWTAGEARTLGQLMTGDNFDQWFPYRRNVDAFIPNVTGKHAPFNDPKLARYYHTLGLYYPLRIGTVSALAFKSGLHMAYDGPAVPIVDLWHQILAEVRPRLVITTGTGGGIGADIGLGDVVIASATRFLLTGTLKDKPFANASYPAAPVDSATIKALGTSSLLKPNGDLLETPRIPQFVLPTQQGDTIVSTDTFAFDDSTDACGLQGLGKCCDMGDATLGLALSTLGAGAPAWVAIRNASDPQIPNPTGNFAAAKAEAERIYSTYQLVTTAGSVVATWATVLSQFPAHALSETMLAEPAALAPVPPPPETAESLLLAMTTAASIDRRAIPVGEVAHATVEALKAHLAEINVPYDSSTLGATRVSFEDLVRRQHVLYVIDVSNDDAEVFTATYVLSGSTIVAKFEAVSS